MDNNTNNGNKNTSPDSNGRMRPRRNPDLNEGGTPQRRMPPDSNAGRRGTSAARPQGPSSPGAAEKDSSLNIERIYRNSPQDSDTGADKRAGSLRPVSPSQPENEAPHMRRNVRGRAGEQTPRPQNVQSQNELPNVGNKAQGGAPRSDAPPASRQVPPHKAAQGPRQSPSPSSVAKGDVSDEDSKTRLSTVIPKVTPDSANSPTPPQNKKQKKSARRENTMVSGLLKGIIYIVVVIVVSAFSGYAIITVGNDIFAFVKKTDIVQVEIPEDADVNYIAKMLGENDIIKYPSVFKLYVKYKKFKGSFDPGTYEINPSMNYDELLYAFKPKYVRETVWLSIPEGFTVDEIINLFVSQGIGTKEGFIDAINNYDYEYKFIDELEQTLSPNRSYRLEGYLFPDTYEFYTDSSEVEIIRKFLNNFDRKFPQIYYDRAKELGFTVDEIITIASMIEEETKLLSEFELVSSVFHNRLNNRRDFPYLESDATIMYAIQLKTGERPSKLTETTFDSPYNTYKNKGLPPGPIANPGYNAIANALYPASTDKYYFVSRSDGSNIFSRTLKEHNAAIAEIKKNG